MDRQNIPEITIEDEEFIYYPERGEIYSKTEQYNRGYNNEYEFFERDNVRIWSFSEIWKKYWGLSIEQEMVINHIDRNPRNNRITNLEKITKCQNSQYRGKRVSKTSSKYKGVTNNRGKWQAAIYCKGVRIYLGIFINELEAAKVYDKRAQFFNDTENCMFLTNEVLGLYD